MLTAGKFSASPFKGNLSIDTAFWTVPLKINFPEPNQLWNVEHLFFNTVAAKDFIVFFC